MTKKGGSIGKTLPAMLTLFSCIVSSMADWVLGCGAVDLVGQTDLGEDGPLLELELPAPFGVFDYHVRPEDVGGHQVGGELDAGEVQIERLGQGADEQGFPQPRHALQEAVPADEEAREHAVHHLAVADDHPPKLFAHFFVPGREFLPPASGSIRYRSCVLVLVSILRFSTGSPIKYPARGSVL